MSCLSVLCLHIEPVERLGLGPVVLDTLQNLVGGPPVADRGHTHIRSSRRVFAQRPTVLAPASAANAVAAGAA